MAARGARRWKHCNLLVLRIGFLFSMQATVKSIHWRQKIAKVLSCSPVLMSVTAAGIPSSPCWDQSWSVCLWRAPWAAGISRWEVQCDHLLLRNMLLTCIALLAEMILAGTSLSCIKQAQVTKWHQTAHHGSQFLLQGDLQLLRRGRCSDGATWSQCFWDESALLLPANSSLLWIYGCSSSLRIQPAALKHFTFAFTLHFAYLHLITQQCTLGPSR